MKTVILFGVMMFVSMMVVALFADKAPWLSHKVITWAGLGITKGHCLGTGLAVIVTAFFSGKK
jgi:hypothetical protein